MQDRPDQITQPGREAEQGCELTNTNTNRTMITIAREPVNRQASKLLWKSPWWAKAPDEEKAKVLQDAFRLDWEACIDYTKSPPLRPGGKQNQVQDLTGLEIYWPLSDQSAIIVGFADTKTKVVTAYRKARGKIEVRNKHYYYWWAMTEDGTFRRITGTGQGKKAKGWVTAKNNKPTQPTE